MTPDREDEKEKETGRVEAFSDGVFAIAITLLVLELRVPRSHELAGASLAAALVRLWPGYLAFGISFATILVMWVNHHRLFRVIHRTDYAFLYWNGALLLCVTFVPFPTAVLSEYLRDAQAHVAASFYSGTFLAISVVFNGLWRYASKDRRLLGRKADPEEVDRITRQYRFGLPLYLAALTLSFVSVPASVGLVLALALFFAVGHTLSK